MTSLSSGNSIFQQVQGINCTFSLLES
jgi:hypothetical protein